MAISDIIYRTTDLLKWGAGVGRNLVAEEIDGNFWALVDALAEIETTPGNGIVSIDQTPGTNTLVITMDDASTYSFAIPIGSVRFTGAWQASHDYIRGDLYSYDDYIYFVNNNFASGSVHQPDLGDTGGPFVTKMIPFATKIKVAWFWPTRPGAGLGSSATMFAYLVDGPMHLRDNLPGARAKLEVAPTAACSFPISKNATVIGSLDFAAGSINGTFTFETLTNFVAGDVLRCSTMLVDDDTAAGLMVNIPATIGVGV